MENIYDELCDLGLPLICAGGIGNENELSYALKIGYEGVQMGTRFIASSECNTSQDYKNAIINSNAEDIVSTTKLSGVPVSVIKSENFQSENSWFMKKLLNSRFKHRARMLLNIYSSFRLKYHLKNKNSNNIKKSRQFYSAGKSVQTIKNIESATTIMRRLGQSLTVE